MKKTPTKKSATKPKAVKAAAKRTATPAQPKAAKPKPAKTMRAHAGAGGIAPTRTQDEPGHGHQRDASDNARDERLRSDLEDEAARSPADRHREHLTAVQAEEDDVRDDDDDPENENDLRTQSVSEQDADNDEDPV